MPRSWDGRNEWFDSFFHRALLKFVLLFIYSFFNASLQGLSTMIEALEWDVRTVMVPRITTGRQEQMIRARLLSRISSSFSLLELQHPPELEGEGRILPPDPELQLQLQPCAWTATAAPRVL